MSVFSSHKDENNSSEGHGQVHAGAEAAPESSEHSWAQRRRRVGKRFRVATVCLMTFVMCAESLLGSGVASAIAETYEGSQEQAALTTQVAEASDSGDSADGDGSSAADVTDGADGADETDGSADSQQSATDGAADDQSSDDASDSSDGNASDSSEGGASR